MFINKIQSLISEAKTEEAISQKWIDDAVKELENFLPLGQFDEERMLLLDKNGDFNGQKAPRWLCHLIGLRHGTVHIILWSAHSQPRILFQLRSRMKKDFPLNIELSVTGHIGMENDWLVSAYREMQEEIGLTAENLAGNLIFVGNNFISYDDDKNNFHDREFVKIYTQRLRPSGIASLSPSENEVEKIYFISEDNISGIYAEFKVAPGLKHTFPLYMSWLSNNRHFLMQI